jgi:hypothetical protein
VGKIIIIKLIIIIVIIIIIEWVSEWVSGWVGGWVDGVSESLVLLLPHSSDPPLSFWWKYFTFASLALFAGWPTPLHYSLILFMSASFLSLSLFSSLHFFFSLLFSLSLISQE